MSERVMVLGLVGAAGLASLTSLGDAMGRGIAADTAAADRRASLAVSSEAGLTTELAEAMYRAHLDDLRVVRSAMALPEVRALGEGHVGAFRSIWTAEHGRDHVQQLVETWRVHGATLKLTDEVDRVPVFLLESWRPLLSDSYVRRRVAHTVSDEWQLQRARFWQDLRRGSLDPATLRWDVVVVGAGADAANVVTRIADERPDLRVLVVHGDGEVIAGGQPLNAPHFHDDGAGALAESDSVTVALGTAGADVLMNTELAGTPEFAQTSGKEALRVDIRSTKGADATAALWANAVVFAQGTGSSEETLSRLLATLPRSKATAPRFVQAFTRPAHDFAYPLRQVPKGTERATMALGVARALHGLHFKGLGAGHVSVPYEVMRDFHVAQDAIAFEGHTGAVSAATRFDQSRLATALNHGRVQDPTYQRLLEGFGPAEVTFKLGEGGDVDPATIRFVPRRP